MTIKTNVNAIRRILSKNSDGMTVRQMAKATGKTIQCIQNALPYVDDIYVDRWAVNELGTLWVKVYCLLERPPIPVKPTIKAAKYLKGLPA
ncbi:hypothetical protein [Hydrogenophaga sp.]|uniref:hypothetical protein n=1 Tax=Hydrogenophaga sp. TaxID=1904254 RepID=UPI00271A414C|nr:hypothetical protein [Hydrogenophaga sp.]MDO9131987.1 hypothetical protein [Hydrogenophaga sp.]